MSRRRRSFSEVDFWPGFTDVLSGMLLTMVFVLTLFAVSQTALVQLVGGKDAALRALEAQVLDLRAMLSTSEDRAEELRRELLEATAQVVALTDSRDLARSRFDEAEQAMQADRAEIIELTRQIREYIRQVEELNSRLVSAESNAEDRETHISALQDAVNRLRGQLAQMSAALGEAEKSSQENRLRLSELLVEMARKDERIAQLEPLERYRSEFLEKLSKVFADNPNVKVVGDRFVFQSEVLFASASSDIGPAGQGELNKVAQAFRELLPVLPKDIPVNLQVQGHTDVDPLRTTEQFRDNWQLSTERALEVVSYLASQGIPEAFMSAAGFGEHCPRVTGQSLEAKAQNRRIEIRITQL